MAIRKITVTVAALALSVSMLASPGFVFADDSGEADLLKELKETRESVEKELKAVKKPEKKALSRMKKLAKVMQGLLKKCAVLEAEIKRTQKRLEDAEKLPVGDAESRAQRDSAIKTHEKRKKNQIDQLTKLTEQGSKVEEELTKVHVALAESVGKRREGLGQIVGGELRLAKHGRKALFQLPSSYAARLDKKQGQALAEPMKAKGQRLTKKVSVHVVAEGKEWFLIDETRRLGFAMILNGDNIDVFGKGAKDERSKGVKGEERKLGSSRKSVTSALEKAEKSLKSLEALLKAFEETVSRASNN